MMKKVNPNTLWTKSEYAKMKRISRQLVAYQVLTGKLKTVEINGAVLIHELQENGRG